MKLNLINLKINLLFFLIFNTLYIAAQSTSIFPENSWGVHSWTQFTGITRTNAPEAKGGPIIVHWGKLEPTDGKYEFEREIGDKLRALKDNNMYCFLIVWVAPAGDIVKSNNIATVDWFVTPPWIFNKPYEVPLVAFPPRTGPLGDVKEAVYPGYLDPNYIKLYHRLIRAVGNYIVNDLPPDLRSRILYIQSAEGATGDGGPHKGEPIETKYSISKPQWETFRLEAWKVFKESLSKNGVLQVPLMTNDDANSDMLRGWMLKELPNAIGVKNGMFSHGYQISDAQERVADHFKFRDEVVASGREFYARGEQDGEYKTHGWSTKNIPQGLYWSSIYATHCGLSMWNVPVDAILDSKNSGSLKFFNKYAAQFYPKSAKGAFCAFYRGLDAGDIVAFPEAKYGKAHRSTQQRYIEICKDFTSFGALMEDPAAATGGGMANRTASGYNDAGWKILTTNFQRHINQIDPEKTSQAWWNLDRSIYGRFARGFNKNNDPLLFDLDDNFFGGTPLNARQDIIVTITYRSSDPGSWELKYDSVGGTMKTAIAVTNSSTGADQWKTATVNISDAYLGNRGDRGSDFMIVNKGGTNCRFHMIEVEKTKSLSTSNINRAEAEFQITQDFQNKTLQVQGKTNLANISIFDLSGKLVSQDLCETDAKTISLSKLSPGVYVIAIKAADGSAKNEKIVHY